MLSPKDEKYTIPAQSRAERGNRTAEEQESSTVTLFSLLIEMREEMKRRDEHFREELRWRDEVMAIGKKKT